MHSKILLDCPRMGFWLTSLNSRVEVLLLTSSSFIFRLAPNMVSKGTARMILYLNDNAVAWFATEEVVDGAPCQTVKMEVGKQFTIPLPADAEIEAEGKVTQVDMFDLQILITVKNRAV